jgi:hypothetical protein
VTRWWPLLVGFPPLRHLRRWWWIVPLLLIGRELVGAFLMATVVPWLWGIVAALEAAR